MKRNALVVMSAAAILLTACAGAEQSAQAENLEEMESINLNVAMMFGPENWQSVAMHEFAEQVTSDSNGKIEFEFFYSGALVPPEDTAAGLRDGLVDIAHIGPSYTPAVFPYDSWIANLGFIPDASPVVGTLQAASATLEWSLNSESYLSEFEEEGLQPLLPRLQTVNNYGLLCREEVTSESDLEGKRVRVGGNAWAREAENLGGVPVSLPGSEVYTAFQQGTIDCYMGGTEDTHSQSYTDHASHFTIAGLSGWSSAGVFMSETTWDSLPLEAQQVIWDNLSVYAESIFDSAFQTNIEFATEAEVVFHTPDEGMSARIEDYHEQLIDDVKVNQVPASESDPGAAVEDYLDLHSEWKDVLTNDLGFSTEVKTWRDVVSNDEDIDLSEWSAYIQENILDPHRPE